MNQTIFEIDESYFLENIKSSVDLEFAIEAQFDILFEQLKIFFKRPPPTGVIIDKEMANKMQIKHQGKGFQLSQEMAEDVYDAYGRYGFTVMRIRLVDSVKEFYKL